LGFSGPRARFSLREYFLTRRPRVPFRPLSRPWCGLSSFVPSKATLAFIFMSLSFAPLRHRLPLVAATRGRFTRVFSPFLDFGRVSRLTPPIFLVLLQLFFYTSCHKELFVVAGSQVFLAFPRSSPFSLFQVWKLHGIFSFLHFSRVCMRGLSGLRISLLFFI